MIVRKYEDKDKLAIGALVHICGQGLLPERLGGYGLVLEEEKSIIGFCWALTSEDSDVAMIEYFCVVPDERRQGKALFLITKMIVDLESMGKKLVLGVVRDTSLLSVAKLYHQAGMDVGAGYIISGNPETIIPKLSMLAKKAA